MTVRIITDSASDIVDEIEGLTVLPLTVRFDTEEYLDGVNLTHQEFYSKLIETDELPSTSQINPVEFDAAFKEATDRGEDVVAITISSKLSGTNESAIMAAENYKGRVFVVDSLNAAMGERILVQRALQLVAEQKSAAEIAETLDQERHDIRLIALLDTLEYLKRGGRIPPAAAALGEMLSIKPVIAIEDGEVALLGKARGSRKGNNLLMEHVGKTGGIDFDRPHLLGYSGFDTSLLDKYIADSRHLWEGHVQDLPVSTIGATIGTHVGPGAIGVAFFQRS